jgi:hypothetical protein
LIAKECRELLSCRAWWIMLAATGPLVGVSFITAVHTYAEASGLGGTSIGVGQAFSPLVGIWAPTFSAYEIAAVFLLPFVAIRMVAGDRQSGALKLELQQPIATLPRVLTKAAVLFGSWVIGLLAAAIAVTLWTSYGGDVYPSEVFGVVIGHCLNAGLTVSFGVAAASMVENPSTAAILTFGFTIGTWLLTFAAAVRGGIWEQLAAYTPTAMVAEFQHGLIRADVLSAAITLIVFGLVLSSTWLRIGVTVSRRIAQSALITAITILVIIGFSTVHVSWDWSENRQNSFPESDEAILKQIKTPLRIEAHLAPEDPRRVDLEKQALSKLRRTMPDVQVQYVSSTSIGLFEQTAEHYGEVWYDLAGHKAMSRATTEQSVLETIYTLANINASENDSPFTGHPLAVEPTGAATIFYGIWPAVVVGVAFMVLRRSR